MVLTLSRVEWKELIDKLKEQNLPYYDALASVLDEKSKHKNVSTISLSDVDFWLLVRYLKELNYA